MSVKSTLISGDDLERIRANAERAWINGKSHVRGSQREKYGPTDQLVGQLGEYALAKWFNRVDQYFERRRRINENPFVGDGGSDLEGFSVDVKSSLMRRSSDPMAYNLLVRPRERHPNNIYVLCLIRETTEGFKAILAGWIEDELLPVLPEGSGVFEGAYRVAASSLKGMDDLRLL